MIRLFQLNRSVYITRLASLYARAILQSTEEGLQYRNAGGEP